MKIANHIFLQSLAVAFLFVGFSVLTAFGIQQVIASPWALMVSLPVTVMILKLGERAGIKYYHWRWHELTAQGEDSESPASKL